MSGKRRRPEPSPSRLPPSDRRVAIVVQVLDSDPLGGDGAASTPEPPLPNDCLRRGGKHREQIKSVSAAHLLDVLLTSLHSVPEPVLPNRFAHDHGKPGQQPDASSDE
jgi:hypothetical protein